MNIRCAEKIIEKARRDLNRIKQIERFMKMEKFINKTKIEVCVRRCENSEKEQKNKKFGFFGSGKKSEPPQDQPKSNITVVLADLCPHKRIESIGVLTDGKPKEKNENHVGYIKEFIKRIVLFPELKQEIINPSPQNQIYNCFNDYITIVRSFILKDPIFKKDPEIEIELIVERIDDHIMKKIYNEIFPKTPIDKDISFYEQCVRLSWITPAHLDIKKIYVNELKYAIDFVRKIDEGKSVYDKLIYIASAHNTINNTIKFSSGKDTDAGAEELSPIFQYIIIKAQPRRFFSNIYYLKNYFGTFSMKAEYTTSTGGYGGGGQLIKFSNAESGYLTAATAQYVQNYVQNYVNEKSKSFYDAGYSKGLSDGKNIGYNKGYSAGKSAGYSSGYNKGYAAGLKAGSKK